MTPNDLPPELIRIVSSFLDYYSRTHLHCTLDENFPSKKFTSQELEEHVCEVARSDLLIMLDKFVDKKCRQDRCTLIIKFLQKIDNDTYLKILCCSKKTFEVVVMKLALFADVYSTDFIDIPLYFKRKINTLAKNALSKILDRGYQPYKFKALI